MSSKTLYLALRYAPLALFISVAAILGAASARIDRD
jgi:hypothetical protein